MSQFRGILGCDGHECCPTLPGGEQEEPHATTAGGREAVWMGRELTLGETKNRKYQYMESNMQRKAAGLKDKIPDIQKTLETVQFLKTRTVCHPA